MTNTKKKHGNKMKLMSAIGMLTVSAAMLVSSTFAWFSLNKNVTAQTMTIQAKSADPIIEISADGEHFYNDLYSSGTDKNWDLPATTIGSGQSATPVKLKLVTPSGITNAGAVSWGWAASSNHADAEITNNLTAKSLTAQSTPAQTYSGRGAYLGDGTDLYVLTQKLTIRNVSVDVNASNLVIDTVSIDKGSNTIGNAVRVLFVNSATGEYALYEPGASTTDATQVATGDHQWLKSTNSTAMAAGTNGPIVAATLAAKGTGSTPAAASSVDVDVYVFFDGTDTDAYTDLATNLGDVSISFGFAID